jgi:acyl-coenzyme A synthetase/AMP-(fatty) acid ligase
MPLRDTEVVETFVAAAAANAARPAIVSNGNTITYRELQAAVEEVADRLGRSPGVVGVPAGHTVETIAALFGVWRAGGTYCPIDPAFPAQRREAMLAAVRGPGLDGIAYTLFTSGSTGEPKPVMTSHRAIATVARSLRDLFGITSDDRILQFASLNWDTCLEEIVPALTTGASLVLHDDAYSGSFPRLLRLVESERLTVLDLPTSFWHELVTYLVEEARPLPACVRLVIIGGEPISPPRLVDWCALDTKHARLLNTYGCTETTLITHAIDLHGPCAEDDDTDRAPIGWALPHVIERISDDGELLIGGPAVAEGYHGRPRETQARFVTVGGERFFRTGDRVSRRGDGALWHEGRVDHMIKVRGIRVDPAEVEAHIAGHPEVGAVAVVGAKVADHTVLCAYVLPRPLAATEGLGRRITDFLRGRVPAHLIPTRISLVADLPRTASGKVDRRRLEEAQP